MTKVEKLTVVGFSTMMISVILIFHSMIANCTTTLVAGLILMVPAVAIALWIKEQ